MVDKSLTREEITLISERARLGMLEELYQYFAYGTKLTPEEQKLEEEHQKIYGHSPFVDLIPDTGIEYCFEKPKTPRAGAMYRDDEGKLNFYNGQEWLTMDDRYNASDIVILAPEEGFLFNECQHKWKKYLGLAEQFEYCEICDKKKDIDA